MMSPSHGLLAVPVALRAATARLKVHEYLCIACNMVCGSNEQFSGSRKHVSHCTSQSAMGASHYCFVAFNILLA